jgi:hypothetical protein
LSQILGTEKLTLGPTDPIPTEIRTRLTPSRLTAVDLAVLGASRGCAGGTNGNQVVVADVPNVAGAQSDQRLGATRGGYEFHLHGIERVDIRDRAQIAALQSLNRQVRVQHDDIESVKTHRPSPGYAVTNRGTSRPAGINHTLMTKADCPVGPLS